MSGVWFSGTAPASATVDCGEATHTVQWRDGAFHVPAHPDPEGERALAALAGEPCRCLELLDAWERHAADPLVLLLGPRGREPLGAERFRRRTGRQFTQLQARRIQLGFPPEPAQNPLEALLSLEGPIPRLFVATVAAALLERAAEPAIAAELYGALFGRLLRTIKRWRMTVPQLDLAITAGLPNLTQSRDGRFDARLPLRWLTDVWARELDIVDHELTLSARPTMDGGYELRTVDHAMHTHLRMIGER